MYKIYFHSLPDIGADSTKRMLPAPYHDELTGKHIRVIHLPELVDAVVTGQQADREILQHVMAHLNATAGPECVILIHGMLSGQGNAQ